jgi:outer membrane receptor protein involved in Fe transport
MDNEVMADRYVINNSVAKNTQYTVQTDYIHPLKNNQKIEGGLKAILRRAHSDFQSRQRSTSAEDYKLNTENTDFFRYDQDVYSVYGSYSFKKNKTTFRLGARLEHTNVDGSFTAAGSKVVQNYTNVLPNIQASTRFSNAFSMVINYSDRIQRPFIQNLNPFRNNNDPRNISFGNPNLDPQVIHSLSVQARLSKGGTFVGLTFTGSYSNNMIVQYATYDRTTGVTTTTSGNVGEEMGFSANGNINTKITKDWTVFVNGNIRYSRIKNKMMPSQIGSGYGGNANLNSTYTLNKRFYISSYAGFFRAPIALQTTYPLNLWYGIQGGYKFMGEKLSVSFGLSNFFEKDRDFITRTVDPAFTFTSTSTMPFRGFSFSVNWSFGKLSENVSKKKGVQNDDLLSSGNSNN